ncbi:hypothetical protein T09_11402 [Trichinella sp. T9]|nr:hypothetical protein T09_11402 [Trichinella sp. T9]
MAFSFIVCSAFRFLFSRKGPFSEATFVFLTCNLGRSARESSLLFRSVVDTAAWEAIVNTKRRQQRNYTTMSKPSISFFPPVSCSEFKFELSSGKAIHQCVDVGKKCPTADEHLQIQSKEATNRIDSFANANRRMTSVKQGKLSENYVKNAVDLDARYFFKQLHNLDLPLSVYSKNMYSIIT